MLTRRHFLESLAGLTAGLMVPGRAFAQQAGDAAQGAAQQTLPLRKLGRSGEQVTMYGMGGAHATNLRRNEHERIVDAAIEGGIRFFDSAESYGRGLSERIYGQYLTPKYRDDVFIMTKSMATDAAGARRHLDGSRQRMQVDVIDLWQIHELHNPDDVDQRIENGVLDVFLEAKQAGNVRYIGFTGHSNPEAHLRMLEQLEQRGIEMDTCQMPINIVDPSYASFAVRVLPKAVERGYGVLAMKTLAFGQLFGRMTSWRRGRQQPVPTVIPDEVPLEMALGFVWSLPVSVLIGGYGSVENLQQNMQIARQFTALDEAQRAEVIEKVARFAGPEMEFYKDAIEA